MLGKILMMIVREEERLKDVRRHRRARG